MVPEYGVFLQIKPDEEKRQALINALLTKNQDYKTSKGICVSLFQLGKEDNVHFGKFGRKMLVKNHKKTENDILEAQVEDWPFLYYAFDVKKQLIVIEYRTSFDMSLERICHTFEDIAATELSLIGYRLSLEIMPERGSFWDVIETASKVYSIKFELNSPNLFGGTLKTNDLLKGLTEVFHNTKTGFEIKNQKGNLSVPRDELQDMVDYAERGGGNWEIKTKEPRRRRPKRHKSSDKVKRISFEEPLKPVPDKNEFLKQRSKEALNSMRDV